MTAPGFDGVTSERISLLNLIGQGRSGRVFAAMDNVLRRRVVVKRMTISAFRSPEERERLIAEARVLSRIDHPNLLRIHDFTELAGEDHLTFEFAEGVPLTKALAGPLDFTSKLRIAAAVASVLAVTHRHGVMHGALSPESVLVTGSGEIKVTDFVSTSTRLDEPRAEARWRSPEQIRGDPVTRASDLYSFGLLLQEMFGGRDRDLRELVAALLRDAPADRPTAAFVHESLQRLTGRRMRRVRALVAIAAIVALLVSAVKYTVDLRRERAEALSARAESVKRRIEAGQLAAFIIDDIHPKLQSVARLELLDAASAEALAYFGSLPVETLSPREAGMNAKAVGQVGLVQASKGDFASSIPTMRQAVSMAEAALSRDRNDDELRFIAGTAHADLSVALDKAGRYDEALVHSRIYGGLINELARRNPGNRRYLKERAFVANHIGTQHDRREESALAFRELELSASIMRRLLTNDTSDEMVFDAAISFYKAGVAMLKVGRLADAEAQLEEGRALLEPHVARPSSPMAMRLLTAVLHDHLSAVEVARGDLAAAAHHAARQRAVMEQLIRYEPGNADWSRQMAIALRTSGSVSRVSGDAAAAIPWHAEAVHLLQDVAARTGLSMLMRRETAVARTELARSLLAAGRAGAAAATIEEAIEILKPIRTEIGAQRVIARALLVRGEAHAAAGDTTRAAAAWREALDVLRRLDGLSQDPRIQDAHASVLARLGRSEEARPLIDDLTSLGYRDPEFEVLCVRRDESPRNDQGKEGVQ
jgi:serine/threonine protein kinase